MGSVEAEVAEDVRQLHELGFVVLRGLLDADEIAAQRAAVAPLIGTDRFGRNPFEGVRTERIYAVLAKAPPVARLVEHPRILALGEALLAAGYLISSVQAVRIHPGEAAQELHCDDDAGAPPRPRAPQGFSCMWALDDFTRANGSTRIVPGSHRWHTVREPRPDEVVSPEMSAGSVLVYLGGVLHGGGANTADAPRLGISSIYCQPWLRQFENQTLAVPPAVAAQYSKRIQRMLGYSMLGPMGTVDGRDPIRLVENATRSRPDPSGPNLARNHALRPRTQFDSG